MKFRTKIQQTNDGRWRVFTTTGSSWWGIGVTFPSKEAAQRVANTIEVEIES